MIATKKCLKLANARKCFNQLVVGGQIYWQPSQKWIFRKQKKHILEVQLISYYRCTKTFNIHWCWYCTQPKKILKLQTAYAYRKGNTCQRTDSWAQMDNQQPQYCQMQCLFGMSHPEEYFTWQWELHLQKMPYAEDPDYFVKYNLHPVWFEVSEDVSNKLDSSGEKKSQFWHPTWT